MNSFSPEGRIFQVEYAIEAIKLGSTAIAVCTTEGVVLAAEKRVTSPLLVRGVRVPCHLRARSRSRARENPTDDTLHPISFQEPSSIEKVAEVDAHIGVAMSGLTADARTLIDHGRVEAQQHAFTYNEPIPVESLTQVGAARASRRDSPCLP